MFAKIFKYLALLLVIVAISIWFAENPGLVSVEWFGVIVDIPLALALVALLVVVGMCALIYRAWLFIRRSPKIFGHYRHEKRLHKGYEELAKGMVAVAAGDSLEARKHARKADQCLDEPAMTLLLSAQAAQMDGDDKAAEKFFTEMSTTKGMEFLGLRGLLNQAIAREDHTRAMELAKKAYALKPKTQWLAESLFDLQIAKGLWSEAELTLTSRLKNHTIDTAVGQNIKAVLMTQRAMDAAHEGHLEAAIKLLQQALKHRAHFVPAVINLSKHYGKNGKTRKGTVLIEETWTHAPHPTLYAIYQDLHGEPDALKRVKLAEKLAARRAHHEESRLILAQAGLEAQLWGRARDELGILVEEAPSARVFRLMAELVETEDHNMTEAQEWLRKASFAASDPAWICSSCGHAHLDWNATCSNCSEFNTLDWRAHSQATPVALQDTQAPAEVIETVDAEIVDVGPKSTAAQ